VRGQGVAGMERPGSVRLGVERQGMEMQDGLGLEWNGWEKQARNGRVENLFAGVDRSGENWIGMAGGAGNGKDRTENERQEWIGRAGRG